MIRQFIVSSRYDSQEVTVSDNFGMPGEKKNKIVSEVTSRKPFRARLSAMWTDGRVAVMLLNADGYVVINDGKVVDCEYADPFGAAELAVAAMSIYEAIIAS